MSFYVAELWRYPVKSLAGERVSSSTLSPDGMAGDRIVRVRGPEGVRTSRRHYRLLGLRGTLDPHGRPLVDGHPWETDDALALVRKAAGADAWLEAFEGLDRFDILPLLVATDGGVDGLGEREWVEGELHIGEAIIRLDSLRSRCVMTTIDPDTLRLDPEVLRDIVRRFENKLALNAETVCGGTIRVGDSVELVTKE